MDGSCIQGATDAGFPPPRIGIEDLVAGVDGAGEEAGKCQAEGDGAGTVDAGANYLKVFDQVGGMGRRVGPLGVCAVSTAAEVWRLAFFFESEQGLVW